MNEYIVWVAGVGFYYKGHKEAIEAEEKWRDAGAEVIVEIIYEEE